MLMKASVIFNLVIVLFTAAAVRKHIMAAGVKQVLRYYTTQSNLLCAFAALLVLVCRLSGSVPEWVLVLKHVGTVAVALTMLTVLLYLGPVYRNYKDLLSGPSFFLHLFCPLVAIVSRVAWDRPKGGFGTVLLGALPALLYALFYFQKVVLAPPEKRWEDFYKFNVDGKWPLSAVSVIGGCLIISLGIWLLG